MKRSRSLFALAVALDLALFALVLGCSKDGGGPSGPGPTGPLNSGNFGPGQSWVFTFAAAGSFDYVCTNHPGMNGNVTVNASSPNDSMVVTAGGGSNVFSPNAASVKPGGYVRWVNAGGTHNVTSP